jgi:hypothetical protein
MSVKDVLKQWTIEVFDFTGTTLSIKNQVRLSYKIIEKEIKCSSVSTEPLGTETTWIW